MALTRKLVWSITPLAMLILLAAPTRGTAVEVLWIYPPPNSLITKSPVTLLGYVLGAPQSALEAKVVSADGVSPPQRESLYLFKGKVFSGAVALEPGRNNVVVGDSVLALLHRPGSDAEREGEFRSPTAHAGGIESCSPCHGFRRGELTLASSIPEMCLECHELGTESIRSATRRNEHTRGITPDCLRCHDPHVSFEKSLLRGEENPCAACHPEQSQRSRHGVVPNQSCTPCHDSHSSAFPNLLKGEALELCHACHGDIAFPRRYPRSYHSPVESEQCFACHAPHPEGMTGLLRAPVPDLCRECHPREDEGAHEGELEECRVCHDAHLSERRGLLIADATDMCTRCHEPMPEGASNHPALREGCVTCHNPHRPHGVTGSEQTCGRCHSLRDEGFKSAHGGLPMDDVRQCVFCHEPHRSEYPHLLRGTTHYPLRNGGCGACHTTEGGRVGLKYEGSKNCVRCHGQITGTSTIVETDKVHRPVYQIDCTACHNPHLGVRDSFLLEDPVTLCSWCHGILLRGVENLHGVFRDKGTCYTCHLPHISDFRPLLKRPQGELCTRCHLDAAPENRAEAREFHGAVTGGTCTGCHNPHGTNTEKLLKDGRDALCRSCHVGITVGRDGAALRYLHGPVGAGNCTACHELGHRHEREGDVFLRKKGSRVCSLCHETSTEHVPANYRPKMREVRNDCLACHEAHGADNPFLLQAGF
jgi:predicted CXXCH cytochrome family protein